MRGLVVEALEAAPLFVAEVVADGLAEVRAQRGRRKAGAGGVLLGDRVAAVEPRGLCGLEEALVVGGERARAGRTTRRRRTAGRVSSHQARPRSSDVREPAFDLERGVPDDERAARPADACDRLAPDRRRRGAARDRRLRARSTRRARTTLVRDDRSTASSSSLSIGRSATTHDAPHGAPRADGAPAHEAQVPDRRGRGHGHERDVRLVLGDAGARPRWETRSRARPATTPARDRAPRRAGARSDTRRPPPAGARSRRRS